MKQVCIVLEGVADAPCELLIGKTPMQASRAVHLSKLTAGGALGLLDVSERKVAHREEVLLAGLAGFDLEHATRFNRAPLVLRADGVEPAGYRSVFCGNFLTVTDGVISDVPRDISEQETAELVKSLQASWNPAEVLFKPGKGGQFLALVREEEPTTFGGHSGLFLVGQKLAAYAGSAVDASVFAAIHRLAPGVLESHPVNEVRVDLRQNPANGILLWGGGLLLLPGKPESLPPTAIVSNSPVAAGLARSYGFVHVPMRQVDLEDASADPLFRISDVVHAMQKAEVLLVFAGTPGEAGTVGGPREKVRYLDRLDQLLAGPLSDVLDACRPYRLVVLAGSAVSSAEGIPLAVPLPVLVAGEGVRGDNSTHFDEVEAFRGSLGVLTIDALRRKLREE